MTGDVNLEKLSPPELAVIANEAHGLARQHGQKMIEYAIEAGEALIAAKAKVRHGEWLPWLEANFDGSQPQAWRYMKVADYSRENSLILEEPSLRKALAAISAVQIEPGINRKRVTEPAPLPKIDDRPPPLPRHKVSRICEAVASWTVQIKEDRSIQAFAIEVRSAQQANDNQWLKQQRKALSLLRDQVNQLLEVLSDPNVLQRVLDKS